MGKILVIVDVQNDFTTGALPPHNGTDAVKNIIKKVAAEKPEKIFLTLDTHEEDYLNTQEGKNLPVKHCIRGTWGHKINDELLAALIEMGYDEDDLFTVEKPTFGSEMLPWLMDAYIRKTENTIDEIELVGICTDICVVSNALILRAFFNNQIPITVDASCCGGTAQENHDAAIQVMRMCQIQIKGE